MAGLSSKEEGLVHDIEFLILMTNITKHGTHVGLISLQIEFVNELCGANRSGRTFLQRKKIFSWKVVICIRLWNRIKIVIFVDIFVFSSTFWNQIHFWPHRFSLNFRKLLFLQIFIFSLVKWTFGWKPIPPISFTSPLEVHYKIKKFILNTLYY